MYDFNTKEFDEALKFYALATQKDASYICNRAALNVSIKAAQNTPTADPRAISSLEQRVPMWPRYIASRMSKAWRKMGRGKRAKMSRNFTRQQAQAFSKKIITARLRTVGFVRSGWIPAMKTLQRLKDISKGLIASDIKKPPGIKNPPGWATPAKPSWRPVAEIVNAAKGADKVGVQALQKGFDLAAADMTEYARRLMSDTADEFSAK